jgi:hypothetical protein
MKLTGVVKDGRRIYDNPAAPVIANQDMEGKRFLETFERLPNTRTLKQNARHWTLLIPLVQECLKQKQGVILSKDQAHELVVRAFVGQIDTALGPVRKETKNLSVTDFADMDREITAWLQEEGWHVPERHEESA